MDYYIVKVKTHIWFFSTLVLEFLYKYVGTSIPVISVIDFPPPLGSQVTVFLPTCFTLCMYVTL